MLLFDGINANTDKPQPVLDILAEMIAVDTSIPVGGSKTPSESGSAGDLE
jgi:import receptor subunit TOM20